MEPNKNRRMAVPWKWDSIAQLDGKPHFGKEGQAGGWAGRPAARFLRWKLSVPSCGPRRFFRRYAALWTAVFCCLPQVMNRAAATPWPGANAEVCAVSSGKGAWFGGKRSETSRWACAVGIVFSPQVLAADADPDAGKAARALARVEIGRSALEDVSGQVWSGFIRRWCRPLPTRICDPCKENSEAAEPDKILSVHGGRLSALRTSGPGNPSAEAPGPSVFPTAAGCVLKAVGSSVFAIRRPKPGRLWNGPLEAWCFLPQAEVSGVSNDGPDLDAPLGSDDGAQGPDLGLEDVMPRPVPLLLFLRSLPTIGEVSSYFTEALGQVPVADLGCRIRYERLQVFAWGSSWRRCVLSEGARGAPGVTLDWWTNDDFGLSELREFFEAPFFRQSESVRFHQWMGEGGAHEADFRGHRLRMSVRKQDGVIFVRIQWWRRNTEADVPDTVVRPEWWGGTS